jgi:hypothetical protein
LSGIDHITNYFIDNKNPAMKKLLLSLAMLFLGLITVLAQAPEAFKYQAIARDEAGNILASRSVSLSVQLLKDGPDGEVVYSEVHEVQTNAFGLINLEIGRGIEQSGTLASVDWSSGTYYVSLAMDTYGGRNFKTMGTSQLLSVPYAFYAETTGDEESRGEDYDWYRFTYNGMKSMVTGMSGLPQGFDVKGNVGIGTMQLVQKLTVSGNVKANIFYGNLGDLNNCYNAYLSNIYSCGSIALSITPTVNIINTTDLSGTCSNFTGALNVAGGAAIKKSVGIGGDLTVCGTIYGNLYGNFSGDFYGNTYGTHYGNVLGDVVTVNETLQIGGLTTAADNYVVTVDASGNTHIRDISRIINLGNIRTINSNGSATVTDGTILVDASASNVTVILPGAIGNSGLRITIKKITGTNTYKVILQALSGQTIDGMPSKLWDTPWQGYVVQSDGANWFIIGIL